MAYGEWEDAVLMVAVQTGTVREIVKNSKVSPSNYEPTYQHPINPDCPMWHELWHLYGLSPKKEQMCRLQH